MVLRVAVIATHRPPFTGRGWDTSPGPALNDYSSHDLQYQPDHYDYHDHGYDHTHDVPRHPHLLSPHSRPVLA